MVLCEVVDRLAVHIADAGSAACQTLQHALVAGMDLLGRNTKLGRKVAAVWPSLPGSLPGLPCGCTRCAASLLFLATSESLASLVATVLAGVATELAVASSDLAPFLLATPLRGCGVLLVVQLQINTCTCVHTHIRYVCVHMSG